MNETTKAPQSQRGTAAKRISVGLVGANGFGRLHFQTLRKLEAEGRLVLAAVADPLWEDAAVEMPQARRDGVRFYRSHREMLAAEDLTAVVIAAPIPVHYEITRDCLEKDVFIYLEKPAVPDLSQLHDLIDRDVHGRIAVAFQLIEANWSKMIKDWIFAGRLGAIHDLRASACWPRNSAYYDRANWAGRMFLAGKPVFDGPATNALSHILHNLMYFAAPEKDGFAVPHEIQGELYRGRPIESYDTVCLRGRFSSGVQFYAALTHAVAEQLPYQIEIRGSKGWARLSHDGSRLESSLLPEPLSTDSNSAFLNAYQSFFDFVTGRRARPATSLRDTLGYTLTTCALLKSSGGIHSIGSHEIRVHSRSDGEFFEVAGLCNAVRQGSCDMALFSEMELPWSVPSAITTAEDLSGDRSLMHAAINSASSPSLHF